ncbi:hypothetical protein B0H13DRAFT_1885834 [Mycena leptocephala]|nr:hypothetical protein B0H13DRAFT_1885834 [Mycena leptocephala]
MREEETAEDMGRNVCLGANGSSSCLHRLKLSLIGQCLCGWQQMYIQYFPGVPILALARRSSVLPPSRSNTPMASSSSPCGSSTATCCMHNTKSANPASTGARAMEEWVADEGVRGMWRAWCWRRGYSVKGSKCRRRNSAAPAGPPILGPGECMSLGLDTARRSLRLSHGFPSA